MLNEEHLHELMRHDTFIKVPVDLLLKPLALGVDVVFAVKTRSSELQLGRIENIHLELQHSWEHDRYWLVSWLRIRTIHGKAKTIWLAPRDITRKDGIPVDDGTPWINDNIMVLNAT